MEEAITETTEWSSLKKISFFFLFFYCFLYTFPGPLGEIPFANEVLSYYDKIPNVLTMFVGNHFLHIQALTRIEQTGSGDTTFDYVRILTIFLLSIILTIIAFIFGRKKSNYSKLFYLLYVSVRYYLALYIIVYGLAKIFKTQFPFPSLFTLEERYGNGSPMRLLWSFMGYSAPYTIFAGMCELLAGVLLLFRRTLIMGAFLSFFVMANVAVMNFCYDVPVKLFSLHLALFSLFILAPNAKNLYSFLSFQKNILLKNFVLPFKSRWVRITRVILKIIVFGLIGLSAYDFYNDMKEYGDASPKPPMYGIYKTQLFIRNRDTLKPLITDTIRWNRMIIDKHAMRFDLMTETTMYMQIEVDTLKKTVNFKSFTDTSTVNHFTYSLNKDTLIMHGNWKKDTLYVKLKKVDLNQFLLVGRGFHWINEYPFNR